MVCRGRVPVTVEGVAFSHVDGMGKSCATTLPNGSSRPILPVHIRVFQRVELVYVMEQFYLNQCMHLISCAAVSV